MEKDLAIPGYKDLSLKVAIDALISRALKLRIPIGFEKNTGLTNVRQVLCYLTKTEPPWE